MRNMGEFSMQSGGFQWGFGIPEVGGSHIPTDLQYHPLQFGDQRMWQGEAMANRPTSAEIYGGWP